MAVGELVGEAYYCVALFERHDLMLPCVSNARVARCWSLGRVTAGPPPCKDKGNQVHKYRLLTIW
jgi:hypothetical protein